MSTSGSPAPAEPTPKGKWNWLEKVPWNLVAGMIALVVIIFAVRGTVMTYWPPAKDGGASPTVKLENELKDLRQKYEKLIADSAADIRELQGWKTKKAELDAWKTLLDERQKNLVTAQKQVTAGLAKIEEAAVTIEKQKETINELNQKVKDLTAQLKGGKK